MKKHLALISCVLVMGCANAAFAQLNNTFQKVFDYFLRDKIQLSGSFHGPHYLPAAMQADNLLKPALNSLIATNVSSFPLSSTAAGVTFDFSSGRPASIIESLGPIFAETGATLGKGKLNIEFNYTYLNLNRFRGIPVDGIRFTFAHSNENPPDFGVPQFENDYIDMFLNLDVNASISAASATYGITNKLDIGVAVPMVHVSLSGHAYSSIAPFTFGRLSPANPEREGAAHRFGGDALNPVLEADTVYSDNATGIGDIALRAKYSFVRGSGVDLAALVDVRLPTGEEENFFGTGQTNTRISGIASKRFGAFTPHLNLSYERRPGDSDSDQFEVLFGFDQKIASGVTLAGEFFGSFALNNDETIHFFEEESVPIVDSFTSSSGAVGTLTRYVDLTNIPENRNDHVLDASMGVRIAFSEEFLILGNVIMPLNNGGLRSNITPTFGATINF